MVFLFWRNNNLDDLADSFAGAFNVTNTPNDTNRWTGMAYVNTLYETAGFMQILYRSPFVVKLK
jgi:hypothetical protein